MSPAKPSAVCPGTGHTEAFTRATEPEHSGPAEDNSELQSDGGSAEPAESFPAAKEEISQTAAAAAAAGASESTEPSKVIFTGAK